jgi:hypothetical protein
MADMLARRMRLSKKGRRRRSKIDRKDCNFLKLAKNNRRGSIFQGASSLTKG